MSTTEKTPTTTKDHTGLYTPASFCLVRTPMLPVTVFQRITATSSGPPHHPEHNLVSKQQQSQEVLKTLATDPLITQALLVASTDILEGVAALQHADAPKRRIKRAYASLLRYLTRMSSRPTPFGLFSGIALAELGEQTTLQLGSPIVQRVRTRPDMQWLLALIQQIEEDSTLLPSLPIVANQAAYLTGSRAILPYADIYGTGDYRMITLLATPPVYLTLQKAHTPIAYYELKNELLTAFPQATEQQVTGLLQQLWEHHFLMSDLRPPLSCANPHTYVLTKLQQIPALAAQASQLETINMLAAHIDNIPVGNATTHIHTLIAEQKKLVPNTMGGIPFQVDMEIKLDHTQLHKQVAEEAIDTIEALLRISPPLQRRHHLQEYLLAFLEKYGPHAEIPLLDLLSPESGLDAPPTYTEPARAYPLPAIPLPDTRDRDSIICSLLTESLYQHVDEIELTDEWISRLTQWQPEEIPPPPTLEMFLQIQATSRTAIDQGEWRGVMAPAGITYGGRSFGRFFDLIGDRGLAQLQDYTKQEEALFPDVIFAELSYLPREGRGANVILRPTLRSYEIVINTTPTVPPERVIPLHDLVIGTNGQRFTIRSLRLKKEIHVTQSHLLNTYRAPNVCRFLLDVSNRRWSSAPAFEWGIAEYVPFLPRVVRKKIIISPAQWNLTAAMLDPMQSEKQFLQAVQQWRQCWHVPQYVYLKFFDHRLLLDLEHPLCIAELQKELSKARDEKNTVTLQEMLPDFDHLWLQDQQQQPYMAEVVIPVIACPNTPATAQKPSAIPIQNMAHTPLTQAERRQLPGSEWTFVKVYASTTQHDEIIAGPLGDLLNSLDANLFDRWFFMRYADPEPHLRIRFHARQTEDSPTILQQVLTWGRQLVQIGLANNLIVDAYDREIERYGGPATIDSIERTFAANSMVTYNLIAALYHHKITLDPIALAVLTTDTLFEHWGLSFEQRLLFAQRLTQRHADREAFRAQRKFLCELLQPWDTTSNNDTLTQRTIVRQLCAAQQPVLQNVAQTLHSLAKCNALWTTETQMLESLVHMHLNRLLGINPEREKRIYVFWYYTLHSLQQRPEMKITQKKQHVTGSHEGSSDDGTE